MKALEAATDTLCQERSPLTPWTDKICIVLLSLLAEFRHGHLSLTCSLGFSVCGLVTLCVAWLVWCRGSLPLVGGGFARGLDLAASVFWILLGCCLSFRGEIG